MRDALQRRFGGLPRRYWLLWSGLLLNRAGGFVQPLVTFYLTGERGLSLQQSAWVVTFYGAGAVVGTLSGGQLADRIGRRATLLISALGSALALALLSASTSLPALCASALALAALADLHRPTAQAMVADVVPEADRVRGFALLGVAVNLGFAIAPAIAGWLAHVGYDVVFNAAAAVQLLWAAFIFSFLPETRPHTPAPATTAALDTPAQGTTTAPAGALTALRDPPFAAFLILCTLLSLIPQQGFVTLPGWMKGQGHSESDFGTVMALNGLLIVILQPLLMERMGRLDGPRTFMASTLLYGAGFAIHGLGSDLWLHRLAVGVWTVGEVFCFPVMFSVVAALSPPEARGRYQGLLAATFAIAACAAPLLGAFVMERAGGPALWWACLGLGVVVSVGMGGLAPSLRARLRGAGA